MMKKHLSKSLLLIFVLVACQGPPSSEQMEGWKAEIVAVEKAFNDMAQEEGLIKAFEYYAAEDGVIRRSKKVLKGKQAIREWYEKDVRPNETLTWTPAFVDVSQSGDMAYTYGDFVFTYPDTSGAMKQNKGIFHTVWKRQGNGEWRFVWD
ncbi:MAG: nuclear transport factor 2 family protein [Saprospiraceae bacterium]|nr:nuclear transport factor 2 family protein [Saprospiraceae bacterium]